MRGEKQTFRFDGAEDWRIWEEHPAGTSRSGGGGAEEMGPKAEEGGAKGHLCFSGKWWKLSEQTWKRLGFVKEASFGG